MTERLYFSDCYINQFDTIITAIDAHGAVLEQTAFFPQGGGQLGDQGQLRINSEVYEVKRTGEKKGEIIHELNTVESIHIGAAVHGILDWRRRYQMMRMHTAQHCISRYFQVNYGAQTVSNQLGIRKSRLDFFPIQKLAELDRVIEEINEIIKKGIKVSFDIQPRKRAISFLKANNYQIKYLEMVPKHVKEFRIVSIGDYDFAACAGTHVRNTREIGEIYLEKIINKGQNRERIYYSLT
ncbi:MAG: alanine--tRNA ligase-related protein [Candidatus Thorarchaeota archaeon]